MHSIDVNLNIVDMVLLIKFLKFESKSGKTQIFYIVLIDLDESEFEATLFQLLTDQLKRANKVSVATKLLINYVCNTFDNFHGFFEKVLIIL